MFSARHRISEFIAQGVIPASRADDALAAAGIAPDGPAWRTFFDHLLLWLGGLALGFALMFFIAYNWQDMGRFAKFGMVEAALALAIGAFWKFGDRSMAGKVALLTATIFLGVLLALYGQTYQAGADPWQLFFNWALLMLPWALIGRFAALWIVWVALVNLAIVLYCQSFRGIFGLMLRSDTGALWLVLAFNTLALVAWELFALRMRWLAERWALRLLAAAGGAALTGLVLYSIFEEAGNRVLAPLVWGVWMTALYLTYRRAKPDLLMLALGCLSGIVVPVTFLARHLLDNGAAGGFLLLALLVLGLGTGAAVWLRNVHREWPS
jgi:uncharacterized membrane protein